MAGYTRQSLAEIQDGEDILAAPLNDEFNQLQDAFNAVTGHTHDGTVGNGPKISLTGAVSGILGLTNGGTGANTAAGARTNLEVPTGTSGHVLGFLDTANTWSAVQTFTANPIIQAAIPSLTIKDTDTNAIHVLSGNSAAGSFFLQTDTTNLFPASVLGLEVGGTRYITVSRTATTFENNIILGTNFAISWAGTGAATTRTNLGLGTAATVNTGTSGATIPLLNGTNSWSGVNTFTGVNPIVLNSTAPGIVFTDSDTGATHSISGNSSVGSLGINVDTGSVGSGPLFNVQIKGSTKFTASTTAVTVTGPAIISSSGDGVDVLTLSTERAWTVKQRGVGSAANLSFENIQNKAIEFASDVTYAGAKITLQPWGLPALRYAKGSGGFLLSADTSGTSSDQVIISSTATSSSAEGAWMSLSGTTHANTGNIILSGGGASSEISLRTNGGVRATITSSAITSTVGLGFGSSVAASASDLSRHIALYSTVYGFGVTTNTLNYRSAINHDFYSGANLKFQVTADGVFVDPSGALQFGFGTNFDELWHDDSVNTWYFTSDATTTRSSTANPSIVKAGQFFTNGVTGEGLRIVAAGTADPYISFYQDAVRGAYIQYQDGTASGNGIRVLNENTNDYLYLSNVNTVDALKFYDASVAVHQSVWHTGNLTAADLNTIYGYTPVTNARTVTAGNGMTGGGALSANITLTMGTPGSITNSTTNSVTATSHVHALGFAAAEVYTGSVQDNVSFPIGHIVIARGAVARNASSAVYLDTGNVNRYETTAGGTQLSGTWRARGQYTENSNSFTVFQKVT